MKICCSENNCPLGYQIFLGPQFSEIIKAHMWANDNSNNEYALGVLAALNFMRGFDDRSPAERLGDKKNIRIHANPLWVSYYLEYLGQEESDGIAMPDLGNNCSQ